MPEIMVGKGCGFSPNKANLLIFSLACMLSFFPAIAKEIEINEQKNLETYIIHVSLPLSRQTAQLEEAENSWYHSFLPKPVLSTNEAAKRMVHTYHHVATGFAAKLSPEEVKEMENKEGFLYAAPQKKFFLQTTHTPNFLGLHQNFGFWPGSSFGKGVIIGVLDTGITPGHPSFNDEGVPPPPAKWKGKCEFNAGTVCNNKLIGARNLVSSTFGLPVDEEGHGTLTASTAAGNIVKDANVFGNANGTAIGMAPLAHLAIYRVCSKYGCDEADILAAMDAAVDDGVDVLSLSFGYSEVGVPFPFFDDSVAIGAFGAIQKGVFVSCAASNSGPINASLSNEAPWILTVGASTIDRELRATAVLGNHKEYDGQSLFQPKDFSTNLLPLIYPGMKKATIMTTAAALCERGSLNNTDVRGKIVLCETGSGIARIAKGKTVRDAGGAAMILVNEESDAYTTIADAHVLPATHVSYAAGLAIKEYINSTTTPTATIQFKGTIIGVKNAPIVASFSSRGPSLASPGILKPDIIGPGVGIIAAWPFSVENNTNTKPTFNVVSGTSMACPHLSGIAALLKSAHPDWSPAAIKSAIMTSSDIVNLLASPILDERLLPANLFAVGAGHVNPSRANDPGLIYDLHPDDYIPYLCGLGYTNTQVGVIVQDRVSCSNISSIPEAQLNYPSFAIELGLSNQTYTRTVTNVGQARSTYYVSIQSIPGVDVFVKPSMLNFTAVNQQITYQIIFSRSSDMSRNGSYVQGAVSWVSSSHTVRSPISVKL